MKGCKILTDVVDHSCNQSPLQSTVKMVIFDSHITHQKTATKEEKEEVIQKRTQKIRRTKYPSVNAFCLPLQGRLEEERLRQEEEERRRQEEERLRKIREEEERKRREEEARFAFVDEFKLL